MVHLCCSRSVFGGYSEILIERATNKYASKILGLIAEGDTGLIILTALGFMYKKYQITSALKKDVRDHLDAPRIRVFFDGEMSFCYICSDEVETPEGKLLQVEGIIVHPDYQGQGIGNKVLVDEVKYFGSVLTGLQTQNLSMEKAIARVSDPNSEMAYRLAPLIGTKNHVKVDMGNGEFIVKHAERYGGKPLYHNLGQFVNNGHQIPGLNTELGDAKVIIGRVKEGL